MNEIKAIFAEVLDISQDSVKDNTERDVVEEWDSFNHLILINELENRLNIKFTMSEVENIKTFKDLRDVVSKKC
ncbi:acyl carrier protein [Clostridium tyrobutyricum]|uniref:acyl carrier protein n=1 Tax=Clostridium tyrobutyricum TaxID=1519 RepID=UPI0002EAC0F9|nr:acyl carrier protein [Clostridium tyrobutyricum]